MDLLYDLALRMVNIPYVWGGKNPLTGLDCSGLINVLLHAFGLDVPGSAQMIFDHYSKPSNHVGQDAALGALVFYGSDRMHIDHVGMCLNRLRMIEAGGGGNTVISTEIAAHRGACVKVVPIYDGPRLQGIFLPEYRENYP